jgi:hypothetical protein
LSSQASTLLLSKLADAIIVVCKKEHETTSHVSEEAKEISKREMYGLHYIAGYVIHALYKKFKFGKKETVIERENVAAILLACKGEGSSTSTVLIDALNRGGLWCVKPEVENILKKVELRFRLFRDNHKRLTNVIDVLVYELITDMDIKSYFGTVVYDAAFQVDAQYTKTTLQSIIELYLKVRVHSYAKHKVSEMKSKEAKKLQAKKGLRKTLKSKDNEQKTYTV